MPERGPGKVLSLGWPVHLGWGSPAGQLGWEMEPGAWPPCLGKFIVGVSLWVRVV